MKTLIVKVKTIEGSKKNRRTRRLAAQSFRSGMSRPERKSNLGNNLRRMMPSAIKNKEI